jgi:hypothetical protein
MQFTGVRISTLRWLHENDDTNSVALLINRRAAFNGMCFTCRIIMRPICKTLTKKKLIGYLVSVYSFRVSSVRVYFFRVSSVRRYSVRV